MTVVVLLGAAVPAAAQSFDPTLHQKAQDYTDWLIEWHSTGLGGVSDIVFTDETRTEIYRTWGAGDSEDWTATYLVTQAIRYLVTGETQARDEVLRIASYLHVVKDITGDPGYIARYAAPNEAPWNVEHIGADNLYVGEGEYADDFWLGHESRDKYITWFWGLAWAYEAVDDAAMRQTIRDDFRDVVDTLVSNNWIIVDPWGDTYAAASVGAGIRIPILAQVARVLDDPEYTALFDEEYEKARNTLGLSMFAFFNKYFEYFAFINNYSSVQGLFHAMPDRERFTHFFHNVEKFRPAVLRRRAQSVFRRRALRRVPARRKLPGRRTGRDPRRRLPKPARHERRAQLAARVHVHGPSSRPLFRLGGSDAGE
ncbi:MAG: hypothetical protein M5R36_10020 [Deltaproteobacteria bacterium]|nr:hypothetical protein [Deltaproteobacteria bacterium]